MQTAAALSHGCRRPQQAQVMVVAGNGGPELCSWFEMDSSELKELFANAQRQHFPF